MKLLGIAPFLAIARAATEDGIIVTCEDDNTISVSIEYDHEAEILELVYGDCNKDSDGIKGADEQNSEQGWDMVFNVTACNMDNKLRTLDYNQNSTVRVGRLSQDFELTMATFEIDSFCQYTASYTIKFDYGTLETDDHEFTESGGVVGLDIVIQAYGTSAYESSSVSPTRAGNTIYLGMTITNEGILYNDDSTDRSGKQFAAESCLVNDTGNNWQYTLFDATSDGDCKNDDIDFVINYDAVKHMWQFQHTLFLLGDYRQSSFELVCEVLVCEATAEANRCDAINELCVGVEYPEPPPRISTTDKDGLEWFAGACRVTNPSVHWALNYGDIVPGKIRDGTCWFPFGGETRATADFRYALGTLTSSNGVSNLVSFREGHFLAVATHSSFGSLPAKASRSSGEWWVGYDGREISNWDVTGGSLQYIDGTLEDPWV